jgi:hypothetical protein
MFVQSHTPFADLEQYKDKTILVLGGDEDKCRFVAEKYSQPLPFHMGLLN